VSTDKAISTIEKLIRVAAPRSGATDPERASAALHVCKLIYENNLIVTTKKETEHSPRGPRMSDIVDLVVRVTSRAQPPADPYRRAIAADDSDCGVDTCDEPILRGETVWRRVKNGEIEYVHADCWTR